MDIKINNPDFIENTSSNSKLCDIGLKHGTMIYLKHQNMVKIIKNVKKDAKNKKIKNYKIKSMKYK